jgi:phospholipid transport system substrate-binding protein
MLRYAGFRRAVISLAVPLVLLVNPAHALDAPILDEAGARTLVNGVVVDALAAFAGRKPTVPEAQASLAMLIDRYSDMPYESEQILGRYWQKASPEQQRQFATLLRRFVVVTYGSMMDGVPADIRIDIRDVERTTGDRFVVHSTTLNSDGSATAVDWVVAATPGGKPVIADIVVDGAGMVPTMKADFTSVVRGASGRLEALFDPIRRKIGDYLGRG